MIQNGCARDRSRYTNPKMASLFLSLNWAILGFVTITWSQIVVETPKMAQSPFRQLQMGRLGVSTTIWDRVIVANPKIARFKDKNKLAILGFVSRGAHHLRVKKRIEKREFLDGYEFGNGRDTSPIVKRCRTSRSDKTVTYFTFDLSLRIYSNGKSN